MPVFGVESQDDQYFTDFNTRASDNAIFNYFGNTRAIKINDLWIVDVDIAFPPIWQIGLCIILGSVILSYLGGLLRLLGFGGLIVGGAMTCSYLLYTPRFYYYLITRKVKDARYVNEEALIRRLL